jgi:hypothetical protein
MVGDVGLAEELAQDAFVAALEQWPESGVPQNPGAWLMATAKHRAIDLVRRGKRLDAKHEELRRELEDEQKTAGQDLDAALDDEIGDDIALISPLAAVLRPRRVARPSLARGPDDQEMRAPPRPGANRRPADRPSQTNPRRGARPLLGPSWGGACRPHLIRARGSLPGFQRGLLGNRRRRLDAPRALRRRAPSRPHLGRARPQRAGGPRARRADGDPGARSGARVGRRESPSCSWIKTARAGIISSLGAVSPRSSARSN